MAAPAMPNGISLRALLANLADTSTLPECFVTGLTADSRLVKRGDLFCALSGTKALGHDYIAHALAAGAAAVLWDKTPGTTSIDAARIAHGKQHGVPLLGVENLRAHLGLIAARFYGDPTAAMAVFGITGTNGKTSCAQFIARALHAVAPCGVIGTLGNGLVDALQPTTHTTPDAITLQGLFGQLRDAGAQAVAMEVSSHGLDQGRVSGVHFNCAVFTNLSRDHLDYHQTMEAYGQAKARLFFVQGLQHAVINADDAFGRWLLSHVPSTLNVLSYGLSGDMHEPRPPHTERASAAKRRDARERPALFAERVQQLPDGLVMSIHSPWGSAELRSPLLGRFNASNLLAVLGALLVTGMPFESAIARVQTLTTVPGRMERYGGYQQPLVVVDYAHTPDALQHVLQALRGHCRGQLRCVFGCGGDRDRGKRPLMGRIAQDASDEVIVTDDNPRSEDPQRIVLDILAGMADPQRAVVEHDRAAAIARAIRASNADDVVLIAGKGHETVQIVGAQQLPFSDAEKVQAVLRGEAP